MIVKLQIPYSILLCHQNFKIYHQIRKFNLVSNFYLWIVRKFCKVTIGVPNYTSPVMQLAATSLRARSRLRESCFSLWSVENSTLRALSRGANLPTELVVEEYGYRLLSTKGKNFEISFEELLSVRATRRERSIINIYIGNNCSSEKFFPLERTSALLVKVFFKNHLQGPTSHF